MIFGTHKHKKVDNKGKQGSVNPKNKQHNKNNAKIIFYDKKKYTEQNMISDHIITVKQDMTAEQDITAEPHNDELLRQRYAKFYKNAEIAFEEGDYECAMLNYLAAAKCSKYTEDALENVFYFHKSIENNAYNNEKYNADNDEENEIEYTWDYRVGVLKEIIEITNWLYTNKPEAGNKIKNYEWYCLTVISYACLTWDSIKLPEQQNKPIEIYEKKSGVPRVDEIEPEFFERYFKIFIDFMTLIMERKLKNDNDANDDNAFERR
jgi:hypothetical protein